MEKRAMRELTMNSIYDRDIYSNGNCSGIFVWHAVHHVPQNTKLQSTAATRNLVQELCYLSKWQTPADSAELGHTKKKNPNTNELRTLEKAQHLSVMSQCIYLDS